MSALQSSSALVSSAENTVPLSNAFSTGTYGEASAYALLVRIITSIEAKKESPTYQYRLGFICDDHHGRRLRHFST
jgi:hypothetical protein